MKYHGGKSKYKKYIVPILQRIIKKYTIKNVFVAFCGGANIEDFPKLSLKTKLR